MTDRLTELQTRVGKSRLVLERLADRAAELRGRLQSDSSLALSLDRLASAASREVASAPSEASEVAGEDGDYVAEAWEIALINEEGK